MVQTTGDKSPYMHKTSLFSTNLGLWSLLWKSLSQLTKYVLHKLWMINNKVLSVLDASSPNGNTDVIEPENSA